MPAGLRRLASGSGDLNQDPTNTELRPIQNERVRFYLDHFKTIEEWARIRDDANTELHDLFLGLVDALSQDAAKRSNLEIDVRSDVQTNPYKPRVLLTKRGWRAVDGSTPAAIVIEWYYPPINTFGRFKLYVGVRVGEWKSRDKDVAAQLSGQAPDLRAALGHPWEPEHYAFPVSRQIRQKGSSLDEVALLAEARAAAWQCWDVCAGPIDAILQQRP